MTACDYHALEKPDISDYLKTTVTALLPFHPMSDTLSTHISKLLCLGLLYREWPA